MQVRRARVTDAAGIAAVHVGTWQGAYRGLLPDAYLDGLDPARWATGWQQALLGAAEAALREVGFTAATLWGIRDNARGRRFYERAGWSPDGAAKTGEVAGVPAVEMRYRRAL